MRVHACVPSYASLKCTILLGSSAASCRKLSLFTCCLAQVGVIFGIENAQASAQYSLNLYFVDWRGELGPWPVHLPNKQPGVIVPETAVYAWCGCLPSALGGCGTKPARQLLELEAASPGE